MKEVYIMRKTLSLILSVIMILSVCSFAIPASAAPEGTAINTADEFMAMVSTAADATEITAKYYLASDITLAATYAEPFWGILDGNGHTVTISNPMFADFSGEVKNLTIKGEIYYTDMDAAAFTITSSKAFTATNCTNNANVTVMGLGKHIGGFVSSIKKVETAVVFTDCVNNGAIYIDSTADEKMRAGGFGGIVDSVILTNCVNNGSVYAKGNACVAAGFVSRAGYTAGMYTAEAYNCTNNGNITYEDTYIAKDGVSQGSAGGDVGGIFGNVGTKGNAGWYKAWGCVNNGDLKGEYRVGGIFGYVYGSGSTAFSDMQFCINTGNITFGRTTPKDGTDYYDWASPFVAYTNTPFTTIKYCIDTGTITKKENALSMNPGLSFVGCSSADTTQYDVKGVYVLNKEQYMYFSYASAESNAANRHEISIADGIIVTTLEDVKSGKVCYEINALAEKDDYGWADSDSDAPWYFCQKIGTDNYPYGTKTIDNWVVLEGSSYKNGAKVAETEPATTEAPKTEAPVETTEAPVEETQAPAVETEAPAQQTEAPAQTEAPKTEGGCGGFVAGGVAIVAILGTALIIKKRD